MVVRIQGHLHQPPLQDDTQQRVTLLPLPPTPTPMAPLPMAPLPMAPLPMAPPPPPPRSLRSQTTSTCTAALGSCTS